jgi:four helix bundle protein
MKIRKFEELECWQEARRMCRSIYSYTRRSRFVKDFRLSDQMRGAAISVMNNISEGFDSNSNKEFIRYLTYSRRSCSEVQACLYVAMDQAYINEKEFRAAYKHGEKVRKIIDGLIRHLRKSQRANRLNGQTG